MPFKACWIWKELARKVDSVALQIQKCRSMKRERICFLEPFGEKQAVIRINGN